MRVVGFRDLDLVDYIVIQDDRAVGRIYEDRQTLPDLRWFWSITIYVNPKRDILTHPKRRACHDSGQPSSASRLSRPIFPSAAHGVRFGGQWPIWHSPPPRASSPPPATPWQLPPVARSTASASRGRSRHPARSRYRYGCSPRFDLPWTAGVCDIERIGPSTEGRVRLSE